ncbi:MAG: hypothetical protein Q7S27_04830 [Nanoarchaeota archaeon]|nr:hypothetical protein [Nanoarchaeota archaeon]
MGIEYGTIIHRITFKESELVSDIAKELRDKHPALDERESLKLAQNSLNGLRRDYDESLYKGLVREGVNYGVKLYGESGSEGPVEDFGLG